MADCFLIAVPLALVIVEINEYRVIAFVFADDVGFDSLNTFISWCCTDDLFWGNRDAPDLGA